MLNYVLKVLVQEIVAAISRAVSDYVALQKKKKEDKEKVKDALKETDPVARARRVRDLLS